MSIAIVVFIGLFVGAGSALLGLGGSIFIIPMLPFAIDLPLREIIATSIFTVGLVTLVNSLKFQQKKLIDWKIALQILPLSALFSFLSSMYANHISDLAIKIMMTSVISLMIFRLLFFKNQEFNLSPNLKKLLVFVVATIAGLLSGLTGIGAGILIGPTLIIFHLTDLKKVSPIINVIIFVSCLFASINYLSRDVMTYPKIGLVRVDIATSLFFAAQFGAWWGRHYNEKVSPPLRKKVVGVVLCLFVVKLWTLN